MTYRGLLIERRSLSILRGVVVALSFAPSLLASTISASAQDRVPVLNIEPSCRAGAAASLQGNLDENYRTCMADENSARAELEKQWGQFARADRASCLNMTEEMGGTSASYVELLECVKMAQEAAGMEKNTTPDRTTGKGE